MARLISDTKRAVENQVSNTADPTSEVIGCGEDIQ
jgi:hypothetical protein